ncbi:hypothetical protein KKF84_05975 [Myxococcota bacterium]|nr:hypothetical protein [Myxococcota bacterium]MBU1534847.1 hypothetical protein [Myxococcota bacterium]
MFRIPLIGLLLVAGACSSKKDKKLPPLPAAPMSARGTENLSERDKELKSQGKTDPDENNLKKVLAFRRLKSGPGKNIYKGGSMGLVPAMALPEGMNAEPVFVLLSSAEVESLKATLAPCVKTRQVVQVTVDPKGKARLSAGQILPTPIVKCLAGKLERVSFFEGKLRKGRIPLP